MATATLSLNTLWDIEDFWDFGITQISTDGGTTWTSLANEYTTTDHDPNAYPEIIANLPGLTSWTEGAWIDMDFDLTPFVGGLATVRFRYMTDWGTEYPGWWIESVALNEEVIDDSAFYHPPKPETDFMVTLIRVDYFGGKPFYSIVHDMDLDPETEEGSEWLLPYTMPNPFPHNNKKPDLYMIVSPLLGFADYEFSVVRGYKLRHGYK
jgi:hypothetical protein